MTSASSTGRAVALTAAWIQGPWQDFLVFVGVPFVIAPAILLAQQQWPAAALYAVVASLGGVGHHLPGMLRAYGDRALFARFKVRFIVAPIFLTALGVGFALWTLSPLKIVLFCWGLWHGFMQAHGIARIYDGKVRSVDATTIRLDFLLLGSWFFAIVLISPLRLPQLIGFLYDCGVPPIPSAPIATLRVLGLAAAVAITLAYLANAVRRARAGSPPNALKLVLHGTTLGFWAFCHLWVDHLLIAILMFEIFHDVQYLAIVWLFNRRRVEMDPAAGAFTRFLFRQRGYLLLIYVAMVAAYGSLGLTPGGERDAYGFDGVIGGLLIASALLHFYYDGFIWKLRERGTSRTLGVQADDAVDWVGRRRLPQWAGHALLWGLFALPLAALSLGAAQIDSPMGEVERYRSLVALVPANGKLHAKLAEAFARDGDLEAAIAEGRAALGRLGAGRQHAETRAMAQANLVTALMRSALNRSENGDADGARAHAREAASLDGQVPEKARRFARDARERGSLEPAAAHYELLVSLDPGDVESQVGLALVREAQGRVAEGCAHAARAAAAAPDDASAVALARRLRAVCADAPRSDLAPL